MVKMLFATQKQSELLINSANDDNRLKPFFKQYQQDKSADLKKLDEKISINFVKIRSAIIITMVVSCSLILYFVLKSTSSATLENIFAIMTFALLLTILILMPLMSLAINPWLYRYRDNSRKQFVEYIEKMG